MISRRIIDADNIVRQSTMYGTVKSDGERFKVFDQLYRDGLLFWDTSDVYGDNEDLLGRVLEACRSRVTLRCLSDEVS